MSASTVARSMTPDVDFPTPVVERITSNFGMAGQLAYTAHVRYGDEPIQYVTFAGARYGGPVVMVTETLDAVFVTEPERFGRLSPRWVRRFYGQEV